MASITSNNFSTRAGSGSITITNSGFPSTSMEIESIGSVEGDYDIEDSEERARVVYFGLGEFEFTVFDGLDNGNSLFNELDSISSTSRIDCNLSFTTNASRSINEDYYFFSSDIEYDRDRRTVTITAAQKALFTDTIEDVFSDNPSDVYDFGFYGNSNTAEDAMPANRFIENVLPLFNVNNTVQNNSFIFNTPGQSTDGEESYVILRRGSGGEAKDTLFTLAAAEGSVIGSFMGYNFYMNRRSTANAVTLSEDDIEEQTLKINIGLNSYLTVRNTFKMGISQPVGYYSFADLTGDSDNLNNDASKRLDVTFNSGIVEYATWDDTNSNYNGFSSPPNGADQSENTTDGEQPEGTTGINVTTGSGTALSVGDVITFGVPSDFTDRVRPFYVVNTAVSSGQFTIETPLTESIGNDVDIWILNDVGVNNISEQGVDSYASAYGADGANLIELTIFDIDSVRPDQSITFDSSLPSAIAGNTYRPSMMEYDLEADKINIKAYRIG